jgi:hypothetical protein
MRALVKDVAREQLQHEMAWRALCKAKAARPLMALLAAAVMRQKRIDALGD